MKRKQITQTSSDRWSHWEQDLNKWEKELSKYPELILYRTSQTMLFIDREDHSNSWILVRNEAGKTLAIEEDGSSVRTPEQFVEKYLGNY